MFKIIGWLIALNELRTLAVGSSCKFHIIAFDTSKFGLKTYSYLFFQ